MKVIVIGGTGSLGTAIIPLLLEDPRIERIRILSRNEHRQAELADIWSEKPIDWLIGDVRDAERVKRAIDGVDVVFNFAATKRVESCEYNPDEAIKTNVIGCQNVIKACWEVETVKKAIYVSTDKAVCPINVYGLSKALAEKSWIQANIGKHQVRFSACRYGNVFGSNGSVIQKWMQGDRVVVNDVNMTRFFISKKNAAKFVTDAMYKMDGGEIFIPKMKSVKIMDLGDRFSSNVEVGKPRPGEKIHERLISDEEIKLTTDIGWAYVRWPEFNLYPVKIHGDPISEVITSNSVDKFSQEELTSLIVDTHVLSRTDLGVFNSLAHIGVS